MKNLFRTFSANLIRALLNCIYYHHPLPGYAYVKLKGAAADCAHGANLLALISFMSLSKVNLLPARHMYNVISKTLFHRHSFFYSNTTATNLRAISLLIEFLFKYYRRLSYNVSVVCGRVNAKYNING